MQKKFGQNFLVSPSARSILLNALSLNAGDEVWEVGPGIGAMTHSLLQQNIKVKVFEIDRGFCAVQKELFGDNENFTIVEGDFLKTYLLQNDDDTPYILGNLPYNIAATIIASLIENGRFFKKAVFTVQKEVAERICAKEGGANYSSLSVLCSSVYNVKKIALFCGSMFYPKPNVDSSAILFELRSKIPLGVNFAFYKMVRSLFAQRRKTVLNNLCNFAGDKEKCIKILQASKIKPTERAENLSLDDFLRISANLEGLQ
ncbi:MAG: 16S rRNA (adenine(1518)-N(6)/adenine(1519)-N(6)) -dimethyltransferase RsmA [Termitinemataceae bacterium]|nr:MAG: 16S rRNA (adenine(1518)-N(6)/adenine(1519)-N(6)) -dimethyltransferase RsmA [Termitinemataceae bacterium]